LQARHNHGSRSGRIGKEVYLSKSKGLFIGNLSGIGASEGIAIARAWRVKSPWDEVMSQCIPKAKIKDEIRRYEDAVAEVHSQLFEYRDRVKKEIGKDESKIFDAHLSILKDPFFQKEIPALILKLNRNAEYLLKKGLERLKKTFLEMENDFFKHRIDDIQDVAARLLRVLQRSEMGPPAYKYPVIMVAHSLTPSDTAHMDRNHVLGFATERGGETSHVSILARSMGLPAVVGVEKLMQEVKEGDTLVLDGIAGLVVVNPPADLLSEYHKLMDDFQIYQNRLASEVDLPSCTADGVSIQLQANISLLTDVSIAEKHRCSGVGLFRTELPFMVAEKLLSEEEQLRIYREIVEAMPGKPVTIRTLDIGGDKFLPFQGVQKEMNPFLGWRSIRIFLQERDVFKTQIRAILRASAFGTVRILFPMISSLEEIEEIQDLMSECKQELVEQQMEFDSSVQCGIMIEVPSAAICADRLIRYTDFFSIGTNDLIQYTLAVDRNNKKVSRFYQPLNPAILSLIHGTIQAALKGGKPVSLCGEMAGNPLYIPMLLGFGLRVFSMSPVMLPEARERIRAVSIGECEALARSILQMDSTEAIHAAIQKFHREANLKQRVHFTGLAEAVLS
jgi:phosphotransferase system enzyme I (PtsI)